MDAIKTYFKRVFITNWKTSFWGVLAILSQASPAITQYLCTLDVPQKYINALTLIFALIFALESKDGSNVSIQPTS
jgi:hypothetical protein